LSSTQDLLARFHLHPAYDRYVRPFGHGGGPSMDQQRVDKGKGRERDGGFGAGSGAGGTPTAGGEADLGDGGDAEDDDGPGGKGEKKKKNTYRHLIKGVPGKHSLKKDDYLTSMMLVPPKQRIRIHQFDLRTQEDAFTVSLEGLKGVFLISSRDVSLLSQWNVNTLFLESAQAREDRKKRKELKRLAKLQGQNGQVPLPGTQPVPPPLVPPGTTSSVSTPQP
ncbi:hypothetical protein GALMADRAFT_34991, partial [Galerina marginata CBS 339.88]